MARPKNGLKVRWQDKNLFKAYECMKTGMSEQKLAQILGCHRNTVLKWQRDRPAFALALKEGRKAANGNGSGQTFQDYVYKQLPTDKRKAWDQLNEIQKANSGIEKIESFLAKKGVRIRQYLFVHAWICSMFSVAQAMRKVNISRAVFNQWKEKDPGFAQIVADVDFFKGDFFEQHLVRLIASGDGAATIFANRTYNKDIYSEQKTRGDTNINIQSNTQINTDNIISIDQLNLSFDQKTELIEAIDAKIGEIVDAN